MLNERVKRRAVYGLVLLCGCGPVMSGIAHGQQESTDAQSQIEEVVVIGVRQSLEQALDIKRNANTVVDAISAQDIDSVPALDLGEALQAIPGIQVNRDGERRTSEINLRGLPSGFVKTTANGQSFTTPSRSDREVGGANPFGSFEPSVFDGVSVYKSPTAAHQEGGIAGVVDKQLQKALDRPDGRYTLKFGTRYEQLNDSFDPEMALAISKHLVEDKVAVAFKLAASEQNFRRDSILTNVYQNLTEGAFTDFQNWKDQRGLEADAIVRVPTQARQLSETSEGERVSFTGNIGWQVTEAFTVDVDLLYSQRDLGDNQFEQVQISAPIEQRPGRSQQTDVTVVPTSEPFFSDRGENGEPIYTVSSVAMNNLSYYPGNRIFDFFESAEGIFLNGHFEQDSWIVKSSLTYSESENLFEQTGFDARLQGSTSSQFLPTGVNGSLNTGQGKASGFSLDLQGLENFNLDQPWQPRDNANDVSVATPRTPDPRPNMRFYVLGVHDNPTRQMASGDIHVQKQLDLEVIGEGFKIDAVHVGGRYSSETLSNEVYGNSVAGINLNAITPDIFTENTIASQSTAFFNGKAPGHLSPSEGWLTLDTESVSRALRDGLVVPEGGVLVPSSGFVARTDRNLNALQRFDQNFESEQDIAAIFLMVDFSGVLGVVDYSGNIGVRKVQTQNMIAGTRRSGSEVVPFVTRPDYDHVLPSFNIAFELPQNVVVRSALSKALVRPNLRFATPALRFDESDTTVRIDLPSSDVEPYTADMFDLSVEWYNRAGSAISIAYFHKKISDLFAEQDLCPTDGNFRFADELGALERVDLAGGGFQCFQVEPFQPEDPAADPVQRQVNITESFNTDSLIRVIGYELALQQNLDFLPYPWNGFGGVFNYSYVETKTDGEDTLTGISPNSYNLIGYWEDDKTSFRLAYNYRNEYLLAGGTSFTGSNDRNVAARGQLDFSASYRFTSSLRSTFRAYNLTDEIRHEYIGQDQRGVSRLNYDGRTYSLSLSYVF